MPDDLGEHHSVDCTVRVLFWCLLESDNLSIIQMIPHPLERLVDVVSNASLEVHLFVLEHIRDGSNLRLQQFFLLFEASNHQLQRLFLPHCFIQYPDAKPWDRNIYLLFSINLM